MFVLIGKQTLVHHREREQFLPTAYSGGQEL